MHPDDIRGQEINRLPEHASLGFNAANSPPHDANAVDHRRVGIRADQSIGIINALRLEYALGQEFEIHLVHDANAGRHDLERVECLHAPLEKLVTLAVAAELQIQIALHRIRRAGEIHLHRVIHHQIHRDERLDDFRVFTKLFHRRAHGRQVHQQRHAGEILQHDARHHERDFLGAGFRRLPVGQGAHRRLAHALAVAIAEHGFKHEPDGDRQF